MNTIANAVLPQELKEAGWKLGEKIVNDDQKKFYATNQRLGQGTGDCDSLDDAIVGAVTLHLRTQNKKVSRKEIERYVKENSLEEPSTFSAVRTLPLNIIRRDGGTQPRGGIDQPTVERYAEDKKNGAKFEPGLVFFDGDNHWLARGFHRTAADEKNGTQQAQFEVREGTQRDAILFSLGENAEHGLPRTPEDKRRAVMTMLEDPEWKKLSASAIAEATKTSQAFVSNIRRALNDESKASVSFKKKLQSAAGGKDLKRFKSNTTKVVGKDKIARETKAIGRVKTVKEITRDQQRILLPASTRANRAKVEDYPAGWFEQQIAINLITKPGTMARRPLVVSGKVGEGDPVFLNFISSDLNPMPPALAELFSQLLKGYRKLVGKASSAKGGRK